jgi:hypothetical protein
MGGFGDLAPGNGSFWVHHFCSPVDLAPSLNPGCPCVLCKTIGYLGRFSRIYAEFASPQYVLTFIH